MSNEELAVLIQGGERDKLPELWVQVERFVAQQANHRLLRSAGFGGVEFGDLYNAGYLALVAAVNSFDPDAGRAFIGWLALRLKDAFAEAGGYRSRKQSLDPLHRAGSLEAAISTIPPDLQAAVYGRYFRGEIVDAGAHSKAMRMLRAPKCSRALRAYL